MVEQWRAYWELMRLDRPVGTFLLLWPTLSALWIAAEGHPPLAIFCTFVLGTFVMRAAGCVINDIADRKFDPHVARTKNRPLADGRLTVKQALICFVVLALAALAIVLTLNTLTRWMAVLGICIAAAYPFLKRITQLPQLGLGIAFSWGILMASTAVAESITTATALLFVMSFVWIIAYDTEYAMVDRDDDLQLGLKSTAILLADGDRVAIMVLDCVALTLLIVLGIVAALNFYYFVSLPIIGALFVYQWRLIWNREPAKCFQAFRNNTIVGFVLFFGIVVSFLFPPIL